MKQARRNGDFIGTICPIRLTPEALAAHGHDKLMERVPIYQRAYDRLFMLSSDRKFEGEREYAALYADMRDNEGEYALFHRSIMQWPHCCGLVLCGMRCMRQ